MHVVPADRRSRRILDGDRVCQALSGIGASGDIRSLIEKIAGPRNDTGHTHIAT
jgi:hypothetical protein